MQHVKDSLAGLLIEGPLDPGHSLLDACAQMHYTNDIKYLAPERCVSRMHEVTHQKAPAKQVELESDRLIVKEKSDIPRRSCAFGAAGQRGHGAQRHWAGLCGSHNIYLL